MDEIFCDFHFADLWAQLERVAWVVSVELPVESVHACFRDFFIRRYHIWLHFQAVYIF